MSTENSGSGPPTLSFGQAAQVDVLCDRFEADWRTGRRPAIGEFLAAAPEPARAALLAELLAIEVGWRRRYGEQPAPQDYAAQFPQETELIAAAFDEPGATLAWREGGPEIPRPNAGANAPKARLRCRSAARAGSGSATRSSAAMRAAGWEKSSSPTTRR